MVVLGVPILFYLIGFCATSLASRWWTFVPMSAAVLAAGWWIHGTFAQDVGFGADTARSMLALAGVGAIAGGASRLVLLLTGWSALRGRGRALTALVLATAPLAYAYLLIAP